MNLANIQKMQLDKQKKILILACCVLIVYVDTAYILKAQINGVNSLSPKITKLKADLLNFNRNLDNMRASVDKEGALGQKTAVKSGKIISEGQISGLLQDISSEANKFDIKIIQIRPIREATQAASTDKFSSLLINLDLACDYHNLGKFINSLENSSVFMEVDELKILTQLPDYMKQKVSLILKTYVSK